MKVNICAYRFQQIQEDWIEYYKILIKSLQKLGLDVCVSPHLHYVRDLPGVSVGIEDNSEDIYIFNHCTIPELVKNGFELGSGTLILKGSGLSAKYFSLDTLGYAAYSSITYNKPPLSFVNVGSFWNEVEQMVAEKVNKWDTASHVPDFYSPGIDIPSDHTLIVGQMNGDETVTNFSFGDHITKLDKIVTSLNTSYPVVVKLHPYTFVNGQESFFKKVGGLVEKWKKKGAYVLSDFESIHDILPKTRVAIVENSTAGLECMMHEVPVISYGFPEYHWNTKELRHAIHVNSLVNDLSWFSKQNNRKFMTWYLRDYLCYDVESTTKRLKSLIF